MDKIKNNMKNDIFSIVRKISPYIPALVISQVLPSKTTQKHEEDPTHNLINFLLDKKYSLLTVVFISGLFLVWMRDSTIDDVKEEAKKFSFIDKSKPENNSFKIQLIDDSNVSFTQLDDLVSFVSKLPSGLRSDRVQTSFSAARRVLIQAWVDPYLADVSMFLCIRALEQLFHDLFARSTENSERVESISRTKSQFTNDRAASEFALKHLGSHIDLAAKLDELVKFRDNFVHRDDPSVNRSPLNMTPFQLVSVLLQYRDSIL